VKPGRSKIAVTLIQGDKDVYKCVGVTIFLDYVTQAEQAFLIELGGWEVDPWISLHPNLYRKETTLGSPIPSTAHSNSSPALHDNLEAKIRRLTPPQFLALIDQLLLARSRLELSSPCACHLWAREYCRRWGGWGCRGSMATRIWRSLWMQPSRRMIILLFEWCFCCLY